LLKYTVLRVFCQNAKLFYTQSSYILKNQITAARNLYDERYAFIKVVSDEWVCRAVEKNAADMINEVSLFNDKRILARVGLENCIDSVFCLITYASFYSAQYC
jgi:hypothetical protein